MSLQSVLQDIDDHNRDIVESATWGHLAPKDGVKYVGHMLFIRTQYGQYEVLSDELTDDQGKVLPSSPWLYDALHTLARGVSEQTRVDGGTLVCFMGSLTVFQDEYMFEGSVMKMDADAILTGFESMSRRGEDVKVKV